MKDPVFVETDEGDDSDFIEQYYVRTDTKNKNMAIRNLLDTLAPTRSVIFCNTKKMVDTLYQSLQTNGYSVCELHGDIRQNERKATIKAFKNGEYPILIATDVAARGLDISGLDMVFNYDVPEKNEYYVHRIGRTGRAGKSGKAFTLINTTYQKRRFEEIIEETGNIVKEFETKFTLKGEQTKTRKEKRDDYLLDARKKAQEKRKRLPDSKTLPYGTKNAQKGKKKEANKPSKRTNLKTQGKRLSNEKKFIEKFLGDNKKKKRK
jgi:superfamily II DNA/RNA helicase